MDFTTLLTMGGMTALFTAGAAWGAVRKALNGTRERVERIEKALNEHVVETRLSRADMGTRITRLETRVELEAERSKLHDEAP